MHYNGAIEVNSEFSAALDEPGDEGGAAWPSSTDRAEAD